MAGVAQTKYDLNALDKLVVFSSFRTNLVFEIKEGGLELKEGYVAKGAVMLEYRDNTLYVTIEDVTVPHKVNGTLILPCDRALTLVNDPLNMWLEFQDLINDDPESKSFTLWQIHEMGGYGTIQDLINQIKAESE